MEQQKHFKEEQTFVIIKPDGVQRSLIGLVMGRYERIGLKLVGLKFVLASKDIIEKHYTVNPEWKKNVGEKAIASYEKKGVEPPSRDPIEVGNRVIAGLKKYLTAGPVVAMVWVALGRREAVVHRHDHRPHLRHGVVLLEVLGRVLPVSHDLEGAYQVLLALVDLNLERGLALWPARTSAVRFPAAGLVRREDPVRRPQQARQLVLAPIRTSQPRHEQEVPGLR